MGFELIRNLGGGSLFDAALYVLDEATLLGIAAAGAAATYYLCYRLVKRWLPQWRAGPDPLRWGHLLALLALVVPLALAAGGGRTCATASPASTPSEPSTPPSTTLTDFDRDGYSWFTAQRDSAPFDSTRHPLALDIPGNGADEDGFGGDFRFAPAPEEAAELRLPAQPKHLVVIMLESVRGDAIGKSIAGRLVTPNLTALASKGTWVREAYSHVGFTTQSAKSIFGGALEPPPGGPSLFRDLKGAGYRDRGDLSLGGKFRRHFGNGRDAGQCRLLHRR
jgi:phosphoglycerol transferase MdoB-like AlkP superfamily enzyme